MNCDKSTNFVSKWSDDDTKLRLKRKLTEFSLQLTPVKFADMINYKKVLLENLEPKDLELTVLSDGKEMYNTITDSKMKSLCLAKAKTIITELEQSVKNPDEKKEKTAQTMLEDFINNIEITTTAYSSKVKINKDFGSANIVLNDNEICGIKNTDGISFDVLTFDEGYTHTFVFRIEFFNGDMISLYSAISRDGAKGEKPKVYISAFVNKYYISREIVNNIYI